jgi:uncharacterized membrane protein HdeD (DUF308 family)
MTEQAYDDVETVEPTPWWLYLVTGVAWILVSLVVLRFDRSSVTTVGILVGIVFLVMGVDDLMSAFLSRRLRWLNVVMAVILIPAGIIAMINPAGTFFAISQIVGFVLVLWGSMKIIEAFFVREENDLWWVLLIAGILMLLLGFWAGGRFFAGAALILVWVGLGALVRGFLQIVLAFSLRRTAREMARATSAAG